MTFGGAAGAARRAAARSPRTPSSAGHPHVHQHDVGARDGERLERGAAVPGLADDLHVRLGLDQHPEAGAHQRLVVDEEDPDAHAATARSGRSTARTSKPPPSRGPASSVPPCSATRSRMPSRPWPRPSPSRPAPRPSSRTTSSTRVVAVAQHDVDARHRAGVLEHVGERLLGDAVERQVDRARQRPRAALARTAARAARRGRPASTSASSCAVARLRARVPRRPRSARSTPSSRRIWPSASRPVSPIVRSAAAACRRAAARRPPPRRRPARRSPTASARRRRAARGRSARARSPRRPPPAGRARSPAAGCAPAAPRAAPGASAATRPAPPPAGRRRPSRPRPRATRRCRRRSSQRSAASSAPDDRARGRRPRRAAAGP